MKRLHSSKAQSNLDKQNSNARIRVSRTFLLLFAAALTACNYESSKKEDVDKLSKRIDSLELVVSEIQTTLKFNNLVRTFDQIAYLTPGSTGYTTVKSDLGTITVSLEDITSYANGSKVELRFGNTTAATINGFSALLEWGSMDANGYPDNTASKNREVNFSQSLKSGAWTKAKVVLEGIPPADLGYIRVKNLNHTGISLQAR